MLTIRHLYPGGKTKALTFSYDDGVNFDRQMLSIFNEHGLKGTFNLSSGLLDSKLGWATRDGTARISYIDKEEIAAVYEGHEVALHGKTHAFLTALPKERALCELWEDKAALEALVGYPVRGMAYPFSAYNEDTRVITAALGLRYCRVSGSEPYFQLPNYPMAFPPTCFHTNGNPMERLHKFVQEDFNTNAFFCLAGHSFDYANDNNWSLLEEFCSYAAHRQEIWYATCIQIFDYTWALRQLIYTSDCSIVMNPTALSLWIEAQGRKIEIKPGQTLRLAETEAIV